MKAEVQERVGIGRAGGERSGRLAKGRGRGRLGDGGVAAGGPGAVHSLESEQMAAVIDHGDIDIQLQGLRLRLGGGDHRPRTGEREPNLVAQHQAASDPAAKRSQAPDRAKRAIASPRSARPQAGGRDRFPIAATPRFRPWSKFPWRKPAMKAARIASWRAAASRRDAARDQHLDGLLFLADQREDPVDARAPPVDGVSSSIVGP